MGGNHVHQTGYRPIHQGSPAGEKRGLDVVNRAGTVGTQHYPSPITKAVAIPASWDIDTCHVVIPCCWATRSTVPVIRTWGGRCGVRVISQSCQRIPPGDPKALAIAS